MSEVDDDLHSMRVMAVRTVARRLRITTSHELVSRLLQSGLSLDAALHRAVEERTFLDRFLDSLGMNRWIS
jgi:hypothetical protein